MLQNALHLKKVDTDDKVDSQFYQSVKILYMVLTEDHKGTNSFLVVHACHGPKPTQSNLHLGNCRIVLSINHRETVFIISC